MPRKIEKILRVIADIQQFDSAIRLENTIDEIPEECLELLYAAAKEPLTWKQMDVMTENLTNKKKIYNILP